MDVPKAIPASQPEMAIYRSYSKEQVHGGIGKPPYYRLHPAYEPAIAALANAAVSGSGAGAFPASAVGRIRSYIAGNAIKQDIAYLFGLRAIWGKDCITLHNGIIRDILLEKPQIPLGDRIIGQGSTHEKMVSRGGASALKSFAFLTDKGQAAAGNATAYSLKESPGEYIEADFRGTGVQVYGVSIHDGYHALTLTYGKSDSGPPEYHLIDNGPATSLLTGHRALKTAQELDEAICAYIRTHAVRAYRVGKNKDQVMPARVDVYEIYPSAGK